MATDSFTGTALAVSSASGTFSFVTAYAQYNTNGFYAKIDPTGVTVTKASTFGGSQSALTFPISRQNAISLANILHRVAN
jgi:hypothetical protein